MGFIQSDQGSNFTVKLFAQVVREVGESQGTLECFHQTLKTMLRTYCVDTNTDWEERLPLLIMSPHVKT